ncbi:lysozyme, partial [Salmonella sp. SAL4358]|uniref:lysozyme n=1 Tax=Salmonella sp. SAL4358 TaxID=3159879 RepID=UPI00397CC62C
MKLSERGYRELKRFEGCRLKAYRCSAGRWTIGWGHAEGVAEGMEITQVTADQLLVLDVSRFERCINLAVTYP